MRHLVLILMLLLAGAPGHAGELASLGDAEPVLNLKPVALVESDVVRLSDLFDGITPDRDASVARAPEPGERVELNARWLAALAKGYGLPWRPQSRLDRIMVERASQSIDAGRIEAKLLESVAERGLHGDVSILLDNPGIQMVLPVEAESSLALSGLAFDPASRRFTAHLVAPAKGPVLAKAVVTGRAIMMTEAPVLRRTVAAGDVIGADDIAWLRVPADRVGRNVITDSGDIVGQTPRRTLPVDQLIRAGDLRAPVIVSKNSLVTIKLQTAKMRLTAQGRAMEDGATGEVIRVMNTKSHTIIHATVAESGVVEVLPTALTAAE